MSIIRLYKNTNSFMQWQSHTTPHAAVFSNIHITHLICSLLITHNAFEPSNTCESLVFRIKCGTGYRPISDCCMAFVFGRLATLFRDLWPRAGNCSMNTNHLNLHWIWFTFAIKHAML